MKRSLAFLLALVMVLSVFSGMTVQAEETEVLPQDHISEHVEKMFPVYPHNHDLSQTMVYKVGIDYGSYNSKLVNFTKIEDLLDYMRRVDNITRGVPKIAVMVGYQEGGHDWQYPAMVPLNSKIHSQEHPEWTPAQCLDHVMKEAQKYHTRCTVHTNIVDAYDNSPAFPYYKEHGLLVRNEAGEYHLGWKAPHGQAYNVSIKAAFEDPNGIRKQIDELLTAIPGIIETGVLWTDANCAVWPSEYDGYTVDDQYQAYCEFVSYMKNTYGIDVIGEMGMNSQYGYFSYGMSWNYSVPSREPMEVAPYVMAGGSGKYSNTQLNIFRQDVQLEAKEYYNMESVRQVFSSNSLLYFFLNNHLRTRYSEADNYAVFSDGVKSMFYTGYMSEVEKYDPLAEFTLPDSVAFDRLWESNEGVKHCYFYENDKNQLILGTEPDGTKPEYFWDLLTQPDGSLRIRSQKTGNYLAVPSLAAAKQNDALITTADPAHPGAQWHVGDSRKTALSFYAVVDGQKVFLGSDDRIVPPYVMGNNILGSLPESLCAADGPGNAQYWNLIPTEEYEVVPEDQIRFERLWEAADKKGPCTFYENESNQVILDASPAPDSNAPQYLWNIIRMPDGGMKFQNRKTGNYLAVTDITGCMGPSGLSNEKLTTRHIEPDGDFTGAIWYDGEAKNQPHHPEFSIYHGIYTNFEGVKVYLGSEKKNGALGVYPENNGRGYLGNACYWLLKPFAESEAERDPQDLHINSAHVITQNGTFYKISGDIFIPAVWRDHEIMAYSQNAGEKTWRLPEDWADVKSVDIYDITPEGLTGKQTVSVVDGKVTFTIGAKKSKTVVPAGTDTETNFRKGAEPQISYLGTDTATSGSWTGVYGAEGYSVVGGSEKLPEGVTVKHIGADHVVWEAATEDARGLYTDETGTGRTAAAKTSILHQIIDVNTGNAARKVSVYLADWNHEGSQTLVEVIDPVTLECKTAKLVNHYDNGVYVSFNIEGHAQIRLTRFYNTGRDYVTGLDGVGKFYESKGLGQVGAPYVCGVFFDQAGEPVERSAQANIWQQPAVAGGKLPEIGDTVTIAQSVVSRDAGKVSFQWQSSTDGKDWVNIPDAHEKDLTLTAITQEDAARQYRCVVTNVRRGYAPAETVSQTVTLGSLTEYAAVNTGTQKKYENLSDAIAQAATGETVVLLKDNAADMLTLENSIRLDLGGKKLTVEGLVAFTGSQILDSSKGQGLLIVSDPDRLVFPTHNEQAPLWNGTGYVFGAVIMQQSPLQPVQDEKGTGFKIVFRPVFISDAVSRQYFADGAADNRLSMGLRVSYVNGQNRSTHDFTFRDDPYVKSVYENNGAFALTLRGFTDSYRDIQVETYLISESGVEICGPAQSFRPASAGQGF